MVVNGSCRHSVDGGIYYKLFRTNIAGGVSSEIFFKVSSGGGMFYAGFCGLN